MAKIGGELNELAARLERNWQNDRKDEAFMREY
jgi:hypothetical protein